MSPETELARRVLDALLQPRLWEEPLPGSRFAFTVLEVKQLCDQARAIFMSEPSLITTRAPIKVFGDIHGQFSDLLSFFLVHGSPYPPGRNDIQGFRYLFNGDFVDRGPHSLEVICVLFALKIVFPKQVYLLRGNHETQEVNSVYGFQTECKDRFNRGEGMHIFRAMNAAFNYLPVAALIDDRILVLHGGLGPHVESLEDIANVKKGKSIQESEPALVELTWSDPAQTDLESGYEPNDTRGCAWIFGADKVEAFRTLNSVDLIIRSHEPVTAGFEWFDSGHLVTVFSATNYTGARSNFGAFLLIDNTLKVEPRMIPPEFSRLGRLAPPASSAPPQVAPPTPERGVRRLLHQFRSKSEKSGLEH